MSEVRINILDASRAINGTFQGCIADAVLAGLAAEPETIEEVESAMARFARPPDSGRHLEDFSDGLNEEPWDAGIVFVDLGARIFAAKSSYSILMPEGEVQFHNGRELTEVWLPYRVGPDWLFLGSVEEYKALADTRRAGRAAVKPLDTRRVLYGAVTEFVANECCSSLKSGEKDPVAGIHVKWLTTPRNDLRGLSPREILLNRREHIEWDMWSREVQWSRLKEPAPCLDKSSHAYKFGGFGTHEIVTYYKMVRTLIIDCWKRTTQERKISIPEEIARLDQLKTEWLGGSIPEYGGISPSALIEGERIRLPWVSSEKDSPYDEDCPCCQAIAKQGLGPGFWHLDGSSMDSHFAFSFCSTRADWEEEERLLEKMRRRTAREKARKRTPVPAGSRTRPQ
jgi:hypothetical protein